MKRSILARVEKLESRLLNDDPYNGFLYHDCYNLLDRDKNVVAPLPADCLDSPPEDRTWTIFKNVRYQGRSYYVMSLAMAWEDAPDQDAPVTRQSESLLSEGTRGRESDRRLLTSPHGRSR